MYHIHEGCQVLLMGLLLALCAGGGLMAGEPKGRVPTTGKSPLRPRILLRPMQGKMACAVRVPGRRGWVFALGIPETIGCRERVLLNFPEVDIKWTGPDKRQSVGSAWTTKGRIRYTARLIPGPDHVDVEMTVTNLSDRLWHDVFAFNCLNPTGAKLFKDWKLERTYMSAHGRPMLMAKTKRVRGHMPTVGFYLHEQTPWGLESPFVRGFRATSPNRTDGSWIVTLSDPPGAYMAAATLDSLFLFDNLDRCCIHSSVNFGDVGPGESSTTLCRFYLADGTLADFLKRCRADRATLARRQRWAHPKRPRIRLTPVPAPGKGKFGPLGFDVHADWMKGSIRLRLPETLHSSLGLHFIDHGRKDMPPLSKLEPFPTWKVDVTTGEVTYHCVTKEGVEFGARARPYEEEVYVEFVARNGTKRPIRNVFPQICLSLAGSKDFGRIGDVTDTCAWIDGKFTSLAETTPTAKEMGRTPWLHVLTTRAGRYGGPRQHRGGWWVVDQRAETGVIARISADRRHLVATAWEDCQALMTNSRIPCLHSACRRVDTLQPGRQAVWRGKIYLMDNDPEDLLIRHKGDSGLWPYPRASSPRPTSGGG